MATSAPALPVEDPPIAPGRRGAGLPFALDAALTLSVWVAGAAMFFRQQLGSGFDKMMGNDGDARLAIYICEHWFGVMHGRSSWLSPHFFHPVKGLLGWSDTFLLYEVFYAPFRELGCDPFLAMQLTIVALSLVGFVSFVCLVRVALGAPRLIALAGALVFTFANDLFLHAGSFQFSGIYFVPLVLLLGALAFRSRSARPTRSLLLGGSCGLLAALLFLSTYYISWFAALAGAVALVVLVVCGRGRRTVRAAGESLRALVGAGVGFALGIVPFLIVYWPTRGHHLTYAQIIGYGGRMRDVVNVGGGNLVWSRLLQHFDPSMVVASEVSYAVTPFVMLLVVAGGLAGLRLLVTRSAAGEARAVTAVVLAVTAVVLCVLPLRTRFATPWAFIWHLPGATPIRAIDRLELVTSLVAALVIVASATEVAAKVRTAKLRGARHTALLRVAVTAVLAFAVIEQVNTTPVSQVNRPQQVALLRWVRSPGPRCRSFYVTDASRANGPFFEYQIDAMLISQELGIPTLNGYTAYNPAGWNLENPGDPAYPMYVASWVAANGIGDGVCGLDLGTMKWSPGLPGTTASTAAAG
ncbi:MAG TPA: hypothetical protein VNF71_04635 [Acidimicrobiales bacterium]|nr:hypothetical protein [Acidimicrobiales bacterium]